ncbi:MAG: hypothetical protein LBL60_02145 [Mycoplasmataceae bacterium]|jgi:hypothetical protein|nr:hypothetical protein [Mycoplasmataceae bacterium]
MANKFNGLTGTAAEYFVAGELSRRLWHAALTIKNAEHADILCTNGKKTVQIQVKSTYDKPKTKSFLLGESNQDWIGDDKFYVFVNLDTKYIKNGDTQTFDKNSICKNEYFIVPSNVVSKNIAIHHKQYVDRGGKDTPLREFGKNQEDNIASYENNWDLLWK